jgi:hypothetical protein
MAFPPALLVNLRREGQASHRWGGARNRLSQNVPLRGTERKSLPHRGGGSG